MIASMFDVDISLFPTYGEKSTRISWLYGLCTYHVVMASCLNNGGEPASSNFIQIICSTHDK